MIRRFAPGHSGGAPRDTGRTGVCGFFDDLADSGGGFGGRQHCKDVIVDMADIVDANRHMYATAAEYVDDVRLQQMAVVLQITCRLRQVDMSMKEYVHIIYAIEGDRFLRAHNGTLYLYTDGAWLPFSGIFPVSVVMRVRDVLHDVEAVSYTHLTLPTKRIV